MLELEFTSQFKRDLKQAIKRGKDRKKLDDVIKLLLEGKPLAKKNRDHSLSGEYKGYRDCHVEPDWVLIYQKTNKVLTLIRIGTHADLFE